MTTTDFHTLYGADKKGMAHCPTHDDKKRSLHISLGRDGDTVLFDHGGCEAPDILAAKGLKLSDLFSESKTNGAGRVIEITYDYRDEDGKLLFQAVRYVGKGFSQRRPDGNGGWIWKIEGVRRVLYRLRELLAADPGQTVFLVEGEKDVDRLRAGGIVATCSPMGAGKWRDEYGKPLAGRYVVIIPDNDKSGLDHAQVEARSLSGVASSVRVLTLSGLPDKGDVSDWLDAGRTIEELRELAEAAPEWKPEAGEKAAPKESKTAGVEAEAGRQTQAEMLIEIAKTVDLCYSVEEDLGHAHITANGHQETHRIHSKAFRQYLMREFYRRYDKVPNGEAMQNALAFLDGRARFDSPVTAVYLRLAAHDGRIYWDLANDAWQILEISAGAWRVIEAKDAPVKFRRSKGMLALPTPVKGGALDALQRFINYPNHAAWALHATWLVAALRARAKAFPILILNGEQGSAKSTASKMTRMLLDPNVADLRPKPREDRDLYIAARNGWVCAFDNLSGLPREFSDALCRLATGAGFGTRELYENDEECLFNAARPIIVNGIDDLAEKADLVDRGVFVELPPIPDEERRDEETLWAEFESERPKLIGALADAVAAALKALPSVKLAKLPRMADFAKWGAAAAIGGAGTFLAAYSGNRTQANDLAIRANDVAAYLAEWYESEDPLTVTLGDLLGGLTERVRSKMADLQKCKPEKVKLPEGWPTTERKLGNELRRCAPNLRKVGIEVVDAGLDNRTRKALRTFQRCRPNGAVSNPSQASQASEESQSADFAEDNLRRKVRRIDDSEPTESFATANCEGLSGSAEAKPSHNPSLTKSQSDNGLSNTAKGAKVAKEPIPAYSGSVSPEEDGQAVPHRRKVSI